MQELREYRQKLMDRLSTAAKEFCAACLAVRDVHCVVQDGWTVHQLAAHTRDVDKLVYGFRVRQTLEQKNPLFANFNQDAYMAGHYSRVEPLAEILDELVSNVDSLVDLLRGIPDKAWARESQHEINGSGFTLQIWVERDLAHIEEHLKTVKSLA